MVIDMAQQFLRLGSLLFFKTVGLYSDIVAAVDWSLFPVLKLLKLHHRATTPEQLSRFPHKSPGTFDRRKKTLVLDLDETLIHSQPHSYLRPSPPGPNDLTLDVHIEGVACTFFVNRRPHVDLFLRTVAEWYNVVVFTASLSEYGNPVIDYLDRGRGLVKARLFRESCVNRGDRFIKNLAMIESDLANVMIIDNSPGAYQWHPDNAIPIKSWFDDQTDTCLLDLLPVLDALRFTKDVRSVLGVRNRQMAPQ
eukprot:m.216814 g.216814  ORF g.216814 m.216814 type:complete len:251 (-) comp18661_c0_seq2:100-852(-)